MGESIVLTTERLVLRPFERGDVDAVFAYARHPEWSRYLIAVQREYERSDAEMFIGACLAADWDLRPVWAITLAGVAVGGINLSIEPEHRRADTGTPSPTSSGARDTSLRPRRPCWTGRSHIAASPAPGAHATRGTPAPGA